MPSQLPQTRKRKHGVYSQSADAKSGPRRMQEIEGMSPETVLAEKRRTADRKAINGAVSRLRNTPDYQEAGDEEKGRMVEEAREVAREMSVPTSPGPLALCRGN